MLTSFKIYVHNRMYSFSVLESSLNNQVDKQHSTALSLSHLACSEPWSESSLRLSHFLLLSRLIQIGLLLS